MGLYSITTRASGVVLTGLGSSSNIFNVDHQNHVTHTAAPFLNSWEADVTQMNIETAPANADGTVSLPASLSDELERIRFVLSQIKALMSSGTPPAHWYTALSGFSDFTSFPAVAARLELHSAQQIQSGVESTVAFDTVAYDTVGGMAVRATIFAPVTGVYIVGGVLGFGDGVSQGPAHNFYLILRRGTTTFAKENIESSSISMPKVISITGLIKLTAGDLLTMAVFQNDGTTKTPTSETGARPSLWAALIGRL